jgi:hypothetical protein
VRTRPCLAAVIATCLLIGACGAQPKQNASARFLAQAQAICTRTARINTAELKAIERGAPFDPAAGRSLIARRLSALTPPAPLRAGYHALVSLIAHEASVIRAQERYRREHDDKRFLASIRQFNAHAVSRQARLLGLAVCA